MEKRMLKNVYEELRELASDNIYIYIYGEQVNLRKYAAICLNGTT